MNSLIQIRRASARATRLVNRKMAGNLEVHDPLFNVREIVKQMILLEDHLMHKNKECSDCIRKHLLAIEALAEEATCLDSEGQYQGQLEFLADKAREWMSRFVDKEDFQEIAFDIRKFRKPLCPFVADPRERVAERYESRSNTCQQG